MLPIELLDKAVTDYNPTHVIALFSGGHDSLVSTHVATQHPSFSFVCHINTGIGIEQTRDFVRATCEDWEVELKEYRAAEYVQGNGKPDPQIFEEIVKQYGFAGPGQHSTMYARLKERPLRMMLRELDRGRNNKTLLVTGVRGQESVRRMGNVQPFQVWEGTKIWVAPIWEFSTCDVNHYIEEHGLKRNLVSDLLHGSKECLCGAYAHKGEKEEIRQWYPDVAAELDRLEELAREAGFPWGWEDGPPDWYYEVQSGQTFWEEALPEAMLCSSCSRGVKGQR